jgi:hypothetical protein
MIFNGRLLLIDRLTDRARAGLRGEEEQRGEGIDRPGRR